MSHIRGDLKKLDQMPDFSNSYTKEVMEKLGSFQYDTEFDS